MVKSPIRNIMKFSPDNYKTFDEVKSIVLRGIFFNLGVIAYFFLLPPLLAQLMLPIEFWQIFYFPFRYATDFPSYMIFFGIILIAMFLPFRFYRQAVLFLKKSPEHKTIYLWGRLFSILDIAVYVAYIATIVLPLLFIGFILIFVSIATR